MSTVKNLVENAENCWKAVLESKLKLKICIVKIVITLLINLDDIDEFAGCLRKYFDHKKIMAPGSEPELVGKLIEQLYEKGVVIAALLLGAGSVFSFI